MKAYFYLKNILTKKKKKPLLYPNILLQEIVKLFQFISMCIYQVSGTGLGPTPCSSAAVTISATATLSFLKVSSTNEHSYSLEE